MKVFLCSAEKNSLQEQIIDEHLAFKELLIFLLNTKHHSDFYDFIKSIPALDIDIAMIQDYLFELIKGEIPQQLIDELEELYLNSNFDKKERLAMLECIGDTHCYFYDEESQDDFE